MTEHPHDGAHAYGEGYDSEDAAQDLGARLQQAEARHMTIDEHSFGYHDRPDRERVGHLLSDDDGVIDDNPDAYAYESEDEDGEYSAEESAMHIVHDDDLDADLERY